MKKNKNMRFIFLFSMMLSLISVNSFLFALDPTKAITQYGHNVWYRENGLPANAINVGLQGPDGYLWLGTSAGLFRFDGVNFYSVTTNPTNSKIIETVTSLCISKDSSLWVGTQYSGLRRIKNDKIFIFGPDDGFAETQILSLLESRSGNLWIGTGNGLYKIVNNKVSYIPTMPNYIISIAEDLHGKIWVGTHGGIRVFDDRSNKQLDSITTADGLPHNISSKIYADRNDNVWLGSVDGLTQWHNGIKKVIKWPFGLVDNHITAICEDRDGSIWFGTYKGVSRLIKNQWSSITSMEGLTHNHVLSIFEDHEGSLWVGTIEGINRFKNVNIIPFTSKEGLPNDNLSGIAETPDGSLFFLSDVNASVTRYKDGAITNYAIVVGPAYVARDGSIWMGQTGVVHNIKNGKLKTYDSKSGIPVKWISSITEDDESLLLYVNGSGVHRFVNGSLTPYVLKNNIIVGANQYVTCFYSPIGGPLWIGTTGGVMKVQNGEAEVLDITKGLAGNWVSSINDDNLGSLWISSPRDGLTRYKDGKCTVFNIENGLFTNEIYCVLTDNDGDLWLSSPRGIGNIKRKDINEFESGKSTTITTQVFLTADGLKSDDCFGGWQPAGWKTMDGNIWFATHKGAVKINPHGFTRNELPPKVRLEKIVADQKTLVSDEKIVLIPGTEKIEFHYTALSFLVPERVLFKYKLEGNDHDWVDAGTRRVAYYTNLPPGEYTFRIIACNNDGVWNEQGARVSFILEPHFYQTTWFYLLIMIALTGIIFGVYRLRVFQLLKREKELKEGIDEAIANLKVLGGLIPICANCKKIRDDKGYWDNLEKYIQAHSEAKFSHGICPECMVILYPDIQSKIEKQHH